LFLNFLKYSWVKAQELPESGFVLLRIYRVSWN